MTLFSVLVSSAVAVVVQSASWLADGGDFYRRSAATSAIDQTSSSAHTLLSMSYAIDTDVSEIEEQLLQGPLITSTGKVLTVTDQCMLVLLPDPGTLAAGAPWVPLDSYTPYLDVQYDKVASGLVLDSNDVAYMFDKRNRALHAVQVGPNGFLGELSWSPIQVNVSVKVDFPLYTSMVISGTSLFVGAKFNLMGTSGPALVFDISGSGNYQFVDFPTAACRDPDDFGMALINNGKVLMLNEQPTCGAFITDSTGAISWSTAPDSEFLFDYGEHAHPVFDPTTNQMYMIDYAVTMQTTQKLCCYSTTTFGDCAGWKDQCITIPWEDYQVNPNTGTPLYYRWEWLAGALSNGYFYVACSGTKDDSTNVPTTANLESQLLVVDLKTGSIISQHRWAGDMFNSAPLVVTSSVNSVTTTRVYLTTTMGGFYCYNGGELVKNGPVWSTQGEVGGVPWDDIPASTFTYLTLTPTGAVLIVSTAGGAYWNDEKVLYAIVNGLKVPLTQSSNAISPAVTASLVTGGILLAVVAGYVAFLKVPAFASLILGAKSSVMGAVGVSSKAGFSSMAVTTHASSSSSSMMGSASYGSLA